MRVSPTIRAFFDEMEKIAYPYAPPVKAPPISTGLRPPTYGVIDKGEMLQKAENAYWRNKDPIRDNLPRFTAAGTPYMARQPPPPTARDISVGNNRTSDIKMEGQGLRAGADIATTGLSTALGGGLGGILGTVGVNLGTGALLDRALPTTKNTFALAGQGARELTGLGRMNPFGALIEGAVPIATGLGLQQVAGRAARAITNGPVIGGAIQRIRQNAFNKQLASAEQRGAKTFVKDQAKSPNSMVEAAPTGRVPAPTPSHPSNPGGLTDAELAQGMRMTTAELQAARNYRAPHPVEVGSKISRKVGAGMAGAGAATVGGTALLPKVNTNSALGNGRGPAINIDSGMPIPSTDINQPPTTPFGTKLQADPRASGAPKKMFGLDPEAVLSGKTTFTPGVYTPPAPSTGHRPKISPPTPGRVGTPQSAQRYTPPGVENRWRTLHPPIQP